MRLISVDKDWKHVLMEWWSVVTLIGGHSGHIACLTFQLPHITTSFFRATDDNP